MADLKDKVFLITGASAGIGEGIAIELARLGSKLTLTGRNKDNLYKVSQKCISVGLEESKILCIDGDIKSSDLRNSLIEKTIEKYGRLDVLVNNAGMACFADLDSTTEETYDKVMMTNVKSIFFLTQLAIPHLKETKGNIINISSITGLLSMKKLGVYCMSKAQLDMFTKCLSIELGQCGIRVNAISPGNMHSQISRRNGSQLTDNTLYEQEMASEARKNPLGRIGYPEEVAHAVIFLASEEKSSFISGEIMYIDGGRTCLFVGVETRV